MVGTVVWPLRLARVEGSRLEPEGMRSRMPDVPDTSMIAPRWVTMFPETEIVPPERTWPVRRFCGFGIRTVLPDASRRAVEPIRTVERSGGSPATGNEFAPVTTMVPPGVLTEPRNVVVTPEKVTLPLASVSTDEFSAMTRSPRDTIWRVKLSVKPVEENVREAVGRMPSASKVGLSKRSAWPVSARARRVWTIGRIWVPLVMSSPGVPSARPRPERVKLEKPPSLKNSGAKTRVEGSGEVPPIWMAAALIVSAAAVPPEIPRRFAPSSREPPITEETLMSWPPASESEPPLP